MSENKPLLVECLTFSCQPQILQESLSGNGPFIVKGVLQRANAKNQNGRVYMKPTLQREAATYTENFIKERRALGELDHSDSAVVNLKNVSHNVTEMHWDGDDLVGTVEILPTPNGNILKELFKANIRLGISSRGMGTVKKDLREDIDIVQDDYSLISFDFFSNYFVCFFQHFWLDMRAHTDAAPIASSRLCAGMDVDAKEIGQEPN
jgi:hypothetical protein